MNERERILKLLDYQFTNHFILSNKGKQALIDYSESGDIETFIQVGDRLFNLRDEIDHVASMTNEQRIEYSQSKGYKYDHVLQFGTVFFWGGKGSVDAIINRLKVFTEWVLEDKDYRARSWFDYSEYDEAQETTFEQRFSYIFSGLFHDYGQFLTNETWQEVFLWLYGNSFNENRQFPLTFGQDQWRPPTLFANDLGYSRDAFFFNILSSVDDYFFCDDESEYDYYLRYKPLVEYLLSMFLHLNKSCYELKRFKQHTTDENGKRVNYSGWQYMMRTFIAHMNGICIYDDYDYDLGDSDEPFSRRDPELFLNFRKKFSQLNLPEEYYRLEQFVIKHGEDYIYASE